MVRAAGGFAQVVAKEGEKKGKREER